MGGDAESTNLKTGLPPGSGEMSYYLPGHWVWGASTDCCARRWAVCPPIHSRRRSPECLSVPEAGVVANLWTGYMHMHTIRSCSELYGASPPLACWRPVPDRGSLGSLSSLARRCSTAPLADPMVAVWLPGQVRSVFAFWG